MIDQWFFLKAANFLICPYIWLLSLSEKKTILVEKG